MATDTQRSESISSDALVNDSESGSHKSDSSSSGDSDVVESHDYLGDEGPGCNAGTPEGLSTDDADYDESGVPEDEIRGVPWLSELCREVYEGVAAKGIDGGDIKLTKARFESPWRPLRNLTETAMMTLCGAHMLSRHFLRSL